MGHLGRKTRRENFLLSEVRVIASICNTRTDARAVSRLIGCFTYYKKNPMMEGQQKTQALGTFLGQFLGRYGDQLLVNSDLSILQHITN
jgi:hypothetical protein